MVKVLAYHYIDGSGFRVVRVYMNPDFIQADKDLKMLQEEASDYKNWLLMDVELYKS